MRQATNARWGFEEFGHAEIEDPRWGRRLAQVAAQAASRPAGRVTEVFSSNAAQRQGAYGLLESEAVPAAAVLTAMGVACARRAADESFVFCPVDGTSLTLADHARSKDFGSIGARSQGARGLKVINAMMLTPRGVPIGISAQEWWTRSPKRRKEHRDKLPPEDKEIGRWLKAMSQTREVMAQHAPETRCWFQLDREGDAWPVLLQAGADKHWFTIRANWNRHAVLANNQKTYLRAVLAVQPVVTSYTLSVRAAPKRSARTANMEVRACPVTLNLRDKRTRQRTLMTVNAVHAVERGTTPSGEEPIEWMLLTNRPIETTEHLNQIVFGYSMRWTIEELHRTWKSGACRVEETQLRTMAAVVKWATILIAVAVRVERIKHLARQEPERPASHEFTPVELQAVVLLRFGDGEKGRPEKGAVLSMSQVTLWIAQIGGYAGSRSSSPGSITIARGLKDVRAAARALQALGSRL